MTLFIQATTAGADAGPFNLYSDATVPPYSAAFETGISKATLLAGFTSYSVPPGTTTIKLKSMGPDCFNELFWTIEPGALIVRNSTLFETIDNITPGFYTENSPFPYLPGTTEYTYHSGFSGDINVFVSSNAEEGSVKLYINGVQIDCQNVFAIGPQTVIFLGVIINPTDLVEIEYSLILC